MWPHGIQQRVTEKLLFQVTRTSCHHSLAHLTVCTLHQALMMVQSGSWIESSSSQVLAMQLARTRRMTCLAHAIPLPVQFDLLLAYRKPSYLTDRRDGSCASGREIVTTGVSSGFPRILVLHMTRFGRPRLCMPSQMLAGWTTETWSHLNRKKAA